MIGRLDGFFFPALWRPFSASFDFILCEKVGDHRASNEGISYSRSRDVPQIPLP